MQNQQPNLATFTKLDDKLLQTMSDNDDSIRNELNSRARGIVGLGICNGLQSSTVNYSSSFGNYTQWTSSGWIDVQFAEPLSSSSISVNFEANRYYKFMMHFDYAWAANNYVNANNGHTGRIEVRLRDITHRHDLLYWTNYIDPDYNMGGVNGTNYYLREYNGPTGTAYNTNVNIWAWGDESAKGSVPSSCHAVRAMAAKTSGNAIIKAQFRPMNAYGGVVPPELMDCTAGHPATNLPTQYKTSAATFNTEAINQFMGYVSVEDCGIAEKPAGAQPGVMNDISVAPFFESFENHPYDSANPERP